MPDRPTTSTTIEMTSGSSTSRPRSRPDIRPLRSLSSASVYWSNVFETLSEMDGERAGLNQQQDINVKMLKSYLRKQSSYKLEETTGLPRYRLLYLVDQFGRRADLNRDGRIDLDEWDDFVRRSNISGVVNRGLTGKVLRVLAYAPAYSCRPPTVFLGLITLLQIAFYLISLYAPDILGITHDYSERQWPINSYLIYDPHRRREAWRFVSYMFLHGSHEHIIFNCIMQLFVGIPLEMSQLGWIGSLRVGGLYSAGVLLGALGATVAQPAKYMLGASAGVYALIAAHLATLILNWTEDGLIYNSRKSHSKTDPVPSIGLNPMIRAFRLLFVVTFVLFDVGMALYKAYILGETSNTSYAGHVFGALAGLLVGVFLLENRKVDDWEQAFKWMALIGYSMLLLALAAWQVAGTYTGFFPAEQYP